MRPTIDSLPEPSQLLVELELPDPLCLWRGGTVTSVEQWNGERAPELRQLIQHYEYGVFPAQPENYAAKVIRMDSRALGGKATLKEVAVQCRQPDAVIHLLVLIPNRRDKPAPCFLGMNFHGNYALLNDPQVGLPEGWVDSSSHGVEPGKAAEEVRGKELDVWAIEQTIDRGYAFASFFSGDVVPDQAQLANVRREDFVPNGMATSDPGAPAVLGIWAWGFSRMIDYLVTDDGIDPKRIAVVGHSRNGKTALLATAADERIAMAIPSQSGCGGAGPSRLDPALAALQSDGRPIAESLAMINYWFPHWFSGRFKEFNTTPKCLPFDQHALIALCAPRPVLLSNAVEDRWANPAGQFEMLRAADPVYRLVCGQGCNAKKPLEVGQLLNSRLGYYIRPGVHSMTREDWKVWLDFGDQWLK